MRATLTTAAALVLVGCGGRTGQAVQISAPAPAAASATLTCVRGELDEMAYEVSSSNDQAGTIQGVRRNEEPWWLKIIGYRDTFDRITATVAGGELSVTATSSDAEGQGGVIAGASDAAARDARQLLGECGSSE